MTPYRKKELCRGCGACRDACPVDAIRMVCGPEGFWYPQTDEVRCIQCGRCQAVCPIEKDEASEMSLYFGARAKADSIRFASSSGGVFPVLAEYVLRRHGAVFGAGWGEHMEVIHREARTQ